MSFRREDPGPLPLQGRVCELVLCRPLAGGSFQPTSVQSTHLGAQYVSNSDTLCERVWGTPQGDARFACNCL